MMKYFNISFENMTVGLHFINNKFLEPNLISAFHHSTYLKACGDLISRDEILISEFPVGIKILYYGLMNILDKNGGWEKVRILKESNSVIFSFYFKIWPQLIIGSVILIFLTPLAFNDSNNIFLFFSILVSMILLFYGFLNLCAFCIIRNKIIKDFSIKK